MPLPGEDSLKSGIRYEDLWTIHCIVEVLNEEKESIHFSPPGKKGEGFEFVLKHEGKGEYHQVKRQITGKGRWTINILQEKGVLKNFKEKLRGTENTCHFVSMHPADQLQELSDLARRTVTHQRFVDDYLSETAAKLPGFSLQGIDLSSSGVRQSFVTC